MVRLDKAEAEMRSLNMYPHRNQCCKFYVRYAEQKLNKGYTLQKVYAPMLSHSRCTCIDLATGNGQSHSARQGRREARMILLGIFSGGEHFIFCTSGRREHDNIRQHSYSCCLGDHQAFFRCFALPYLQVSRGHLLVRPRHR